MKNKSDNIVFSILQEHPSVAGGVCIFAVAFSLVAGNAIYNQSGGHPVPLMVTRDHVTTQAIPRETVFKPQIRPVQTTKHRPKQIPVPVSRQKTGTVKKTDSPSIPFDPVVAEIQKGLINAGDFSGTVDGKLGPITKAAIMNYQARNGLPADGVASRVLLKVIELNEPQIISKKPTKIAKVETTKRSYSTSLVSKIQSGLVNFGESEIVVDGVYGTKTAAAIERFQKKFKLPVTGKPDDVVLKALISRNAIPSG